MQTHSVDVLEDLPRGRYQGHVGTPPQAYFEAPENLAATESWRIEVQHNAQGKVFLGVSGGEIVQNGRLPDGRVKRHVIGGIPLGVGDDRHVILLAGSRAGKGRSFFLPNLFLLPPTVSLFVNDPKGELARTTAGYRAKILGQKVVVIDPLDVSGMSTLPYRVGFNTFLSLDPSDKTTFVPKCRLNAHSIIVSENSTKDPHWDQTSESALSMLIGHVASFLRYEGMRDLVTVWFLASELLADDPNDPGRYWLEKELMSNDAGGGMIRNACRQTYDRTGGEASSVISNLRKHLDFLGMEPIQECVSGPSHHPRDFVSQPMTVYVCCPTLMGGDLTGWKRMLIQTHLASHEEYAEESRHRAYYFLDEFHQFQNLRAVEQSAAQIAGLGQGVTLVIGLQDLNQIKRLYPHSWETFIGNAGLMIAFGLADSTSLEYTSKMLGEAATLTRSTNAPGFDQATQHAATGESWSLGSHRLLTPDEVGRYFARDDPKLRQLILRSGYRPAIIQRAFYDQHPLFAGKVRDE